MTELAALAEPHGRRHTYEAVIALSGKASWRIEDVVGGDRRLDFSRPFMPEGLARVEALAFLTPSARLRLNQIQGHAYLAIFGLVEEFILPFVVDRARPTLGADGARDRALLQFAGEEAKHIEVFRRFRNEFERGFGSACPVIGPSAAIAAAVLRHDALAVALLVLHIEWMTQRHYQECVRDDVGLDPQFKSLLRHHWMEESRHAVLDTLLVAELAAGYDAAGIEAALGQYLEIVGMLDAGLETQVALDIESLRLATGRELAASERPLAADRLRQAARWTYLGSGMTHPQFLGTLEGLGPAARPRIEDAARAYC
jgi:hypothetical protein